MRNMEQQNYDFCKKKVVHRENPNLLEGKQQLHHLKQIGEKLLVLQSFVQTFLHYIGRFFLTFSFKILIGTTVTDRVAVVRNGLDKCRDVFCTITYTTWLEYSTPFCGMLEGIQTHKRNNENKCSNNCKFRADFWHAFLYFHSFLFFHTSQGWPGWIRTSSEISVSGLTRDYHKSFSVNTSYNKQTKRNPHALKLTTVSFSASFRSSRRRLAMSFVMYFCRGHEVDVIAVMRSSTIWLSLL